MGFVKCFGDFMGFVAFLELFHGVFEGFGFLKVFLWDFEFFQRVFEVFWDFPKVFFRFFQKFFVEF